jgi:hypothetical protein
MWAGVVTGKNLHVSLERKKHENINHLDPGRAGDERFRAKFQGADRAATTGESNAHTAADLTAP